MYGRQAFSVHLVHLLYIYIYMYIYTYICAYICRQYVRLLHAISSEIIRNAMVEKKEYFV